MDREEAIKELGEWLEQMIQHGVPSHSIKRKALAYAISALSVIEQTKWERDTALATLEEHGIGLGQRAEPSDLISRADILRYIYRLDTCGLGKGKALEYFRKYVEKADSVSAESYKDGYEDGIREERPKAYKIGYNDGYERGKAECVSAERVGVWIWKTEDKYKCSECGHETHVDECMEEPIYEYCPYCGAKMKGGDKWE